MLSLRGYPERAHKPVANNGDKRRQKRSAVGAAAGGMSSAGTPVAGVGEIDTALPIPEDVLAGHNGYSLTRASGVGTFAGMISFIRTFASDLLTRRRFRDYGPGYEYGVTYSGERDFYDALGYRRILLPINYRARYTRGGIARRVVNCYPRAAWAGGADIIEDEDPDIETTFEVAVSDLYERLEVWRKLQRASTQARLGQYAVILIGAPGKLSDPLPNVNSPDDILYLECYPQDYAKILRVVEDPTDPRFGKPLVYQVTMGVPVSNALPNIGSTIGRAIVEEVHYSRIIHVAEECLLNDVYGSSALEPVWNSLDDYNKITGGGAEAAWQRMNPGIHFDVDKEMTLGPDGWKEMEDEIEDYIHDPTKRDIKTRGVKATLLSGSVSDFSQNADCVTREICGTCATPHRIMFGSERGEMASTQDRDNWSDRVSEYRKENCLPVLRDLTERFIQCKALPSPKRGAFDTVWPDEEELNEQEKGALVLSYTSANANQHGAGEPPVITTNELRSQFMDSGPIEDVWEDPNDTIDANAVVLDPATGLPVTPPTSPIVPPSTDPVDSPQPPASTAAPNLSTHSKSPRVAIYVSGKLISMSRYKFAKLRRLRQIELASKRNKRDKVLASMSVNRLRDRSAVNYYASAT